MAAVGQTVLVRVGEQELPGIVTAVTEEDGKQFADVFVPAPTYSHIAVYGSGDEHDADDAHPKTGERHPSQRAYVAVIDGSGATPTKATKAAATKE